MSKTTTNAPVSAHVKEEDSVARAAPRKGKVLSLLWPWFITLLVIGAFIIIIVSSLVGYWLHNVQVTGMVNRDAVSISVPKTTLKVGRMVFYAGLGMTVVNAQYAPAFVDDLIRSGPRMVRLNMVIKNPMHIHIASVYYTIARLLVPGQAPIAPTNIQLPVDSGLATEVRGWIDFAVPQGVQLRALTLQLGQVAQNEELVKLPLAGRFDGGQYVDKVSHQDAMFSYMFGGNALKYHLMSIERRYSYLGQQCRSGQRFYIFNFQVANQNGVDVAPGLGFDYLRMVMNSYGHPPIATTLPPTFKAGKTVMGRVVFVAQAGLHNFALGFRPQNGTSEQDYGLET